MPLNRFPLSNICNSFLTMRTHISILAIASLAFESSALPTGSVQIATISDIHVNLSTTNQEVFDSAVARIGQAHPDLLLITGDLADNGDAATHQYVAEQLAGLEQLGTQVYVIPGNHDLYGTAVSPDEFAACYAAFGYDEAVLRHDASLSYLAYPCEGLAVLCLDSTRPADSNGRHSDGGLTDGTLAWALAAAATAQQDGRMLIGMMHHPVMEHFDQHTQLAATYIANADTYYYPALETVQRQLIEAGINVMLSGHFHLQSTQHVVTEQGELHNIMTGSLASYPSPIRFMTLDDNGALKVTSEHQTIYQAELLERNNQLIENGIWRMAQTAFPMMDKIKEVVPKAFHGMLRFPADEEEMFDDMNEYLHPALFDVYNAFAAGDEDQHDPDGLYNATFDAISSYILYICKGNTMLADLLTEGFSNTEDMDENYLALFDSVLRSIVYNYVGEPSNVVADNAIELALPKPATSLQAISQDVTASRCYTLDGKPLASDMMAHTNGMLTLWNSRITTAVR